jgi:hypothetical protein
MQKAKSIGDSATEFGSAAWNTAKNFNFSTETIDQARGFYLKQSIAGKKEGGLGGFVKQGFGAVGENLVEMGRKTPDTLANARDFVMNWDTDAYAQDAQKSYSTQIKLGQQTGGVLGLGQQVMGYGGMAVSSLPWVTKQIEPLIERGVDFVADGQVKLDKMLLAKAKGIPIIEPLLKTTLKSKENDVQLMGGATKGLGALVGGTLNMLTHPVETVKGIEALMEHVPLGAILPVLSPSLATPLMMQGLPELVRKDPGKGKNPMSLSSMLMMNPLKTERMMLESMVKGQDPRVAMRESMDPAKNLSEDGKFWATLGSAFIKPYQKAIDEGKPMEAVGRGAFEVATLLLGGAEAKAGKVATEGATVAKTVGKVGEGAQTANKVTDVAKVASEAKKSATIADKASDASEVTKLTEGAEVTKVGQKTAAAGAGKTTKTSKSKSVNSGQTTLKTGSKKHKAKSNAETDHSPAGKSDAQHPTRGQDQSFGKSETTNSLTNLGKDFGSHNSSVLDDFTPISNPTKSNQTVFSGVYDPKTNTFITKPSGSTKMKNGQIPQDLTPARGGHGRVRDLFKLTNPEIDTSQLVGFTIYYREQGKLDVAFFSRGINTRNFKDLDGYAPKV